MGFEFSNHAVEIEVAGKVYSVNMGDVDMLDEVRRWSDKLRGTDYSSMGEGANRAVADDLKGYLTALLGQRQFGEIFADREFDLIDGMELFAYVHSKMAESRVDEAFASTLDKYMPDAGWPDAE